MLDHIAPTVFWPAFVLVWFLVSLVVGIGVGSLIRYCDRERNKYVTRDWVTEQRCRSSRRAFKTRAGIR